MYTSLLYTAVFILVAYNGNKMVPREMSIAQPANVISGLVSMMVCLTIT